MALVSNLRFTATRSYVSGDTQKAHLPRTVSDEGNVLGLFLPQGLAVFRVNCLESGSGRVSPVLKAVETGKGGRERWRRMRHPAHEWYENTRFRDAQ